MTHNPYTCAECDRLGWYHTDDEEPWPTAEPVAPQRSQTLILLAFLAIAAIAVVMWTQR